MAQKSNEVGESALDIGQICLTRIKLTCAGAPHTQLSSVSHLTTTYLNISIFWGIKVVYYRYIINEKCYLDNFILYGRDDAFGKRNI